MLLDRFAHHLGRGIVAAAAGTAAMTISSTLEMKLRGRPPSDAPGKAVTKLLHVDVRDDLATGRLPTIAHVMTGLSLGAVRGVLGFAGVGEPAFFTVSMVPDTVGLAALGIAPPPWQWPKVEVAVSVLHHAVFAAATDTVYRRLAGD
jgi:hypothetical protein